MRSLSGPSFEIWGTQAPSNINPSISGMFMYRKNKNSFQLSVIPDSCAAAQDILIRFTFGKGRNAEPNGRHPRQSKATRTYLCHS
jgi:hypothetical protein